jgi:hypothetical protein
VACSWYLAHGRSAAMVNSNQAIHHISSLDTA